MVRHELMVKERIKKEQRIANATFGDRAQIDNTDADDDDDLFGDGKLNVEGKRLRKMMRERGGGDDYDSSDSVSLICYMGTADGKGFLRLERDYQR